MSLLSHVRFSALVLATLTTTALATPACSSSETGDDADSSDQDLRNAQPIADILADVAPGTTWSTLSAKKRAALKRNATLYLNKVQHDWGTAGLDEKEARLLDAATPAMLDNFDRVVGFWAVNQVPAGFKASTDVKSAELVKQLKRLYLVWCAMHRDTIGQVNSELKDWDGGPVREMLVTGPDTFEQQKSWARNVDKSLRAIPAASLSETERAIREQVYFTTRQLVEGSPGFNYGANEIFQTGAVVNYLYDFVANYKADGSGVIAKEDDLLQALNAFTFLPQYLTDVGTVDAFQWNLENMLDPGFLESMDFDPAKSSTAKHYVTLSTWWGQRTQALPDATNRCTVYSKRERDAQWNAFTATNLVNADGKTTMESYAASYSTIAKAQLDDTKAIGVAAVGSAFPAGNALVTEAQKAQVVAAINATTKPAGLVELIVAELDKATKSDAASKAFTAAMDALTMIGGNYKDGDAVSAADKATVDAMWADVKTYVAKHYGGYAVDIASLLPPQLVLSTTDQSFTGIQAGHATADIQIGLGKSWSKASLYSTLIHEGKHAIDYASKTPVQGAAWEGGGVAAEDTVWPAFIDEVMKSEAAKLPFYRLNTAIDNVRLVATTDATLKVYLRPSCKPNEPNSIDFVKAIIAGWGYSDPDTQLLRSRRAHQGTQYLSYALGEVVYLDLIKYLQTQAPAGTTVDAMLVQACGLSGAQPDAAAGAKLKTCIANHK